MIPPPRLDAEPRRLDDAFAELSEGAFAVWIRLMVLPTPCLAGRRRCARALGYSPRTLDRRLRELHGKGYVRLIMRREGRSTQIVLARRALIVGPSEFMSVC